MQVPFGHQVLIPRPKLLGVGGAGGGPFAPDVGEPRLKDRIGDISNRLLQCLLMQVAPVDVDEVLITLPMISHADA